MNALALQPHRFWIGGLALALCVLIAAPLATIRLQEEMENRQEKLLAHGKTLSTQLAQWKKDANEARQLSASLGGEAIEPYLAPADRAMLAAQLEPLAATARLLHLTYTLGPEERWAGNPMFPHIQGIVQSHLSIEAEAALDADVFRFLDSLSSLPGRLDLERLEIKRIGGAENQPLDISNLHVRLELRWLANAPLTGDAL